MENESPWGPRIPVSIDTSSGIMSAGDATRPIDVNGDVDFALSSYLSMVYELRNMATGVIPLREEDILALASAFEMEETDVAGRLARLMHCDDLQTKRFIQMVKKGRVLVPVSMVAAGALLAVSLSFVNPAEADPPLRTESKPNVEVVSDAIPSNVVSLGEGLQVERAEVTDDTNTSVPTTTYSVNSTGEVSVKSNENIDAPDDSVVFPGPGEVIIGDGISISRDDPSN